MPTTLTEYTHQAQEQTLKVIRDSQEGVVEAVRAWASALEKAVPDVPALPLADEFPSPKEIVQTSFGFAEQLLHAQREFVESVLAAASPVLDASASSEHKKPAAKSA